MGQTTLGCRRPAPPSSATSDALAAIERLGIPVLRTWRRDAIRIRWTDEGLTAVAFLDGTARPAKRRIGQGKGTIELAQPDRTKEPDSPRAATAPGIQLLVGLTGFMVGAFACLFLAVIEIEPWHSSCHTDQSRAARSSTWRRACG